MRFTIKKKRSILPSTKEVNDVANNETVALLRRVALRLEATTMEAVAWPEVDTLDGTDSYISCLLKKMAKGNDYIYKDEIGRVLYYIADMLEE